MMTARPALRNAIFVTLLTIFGVLAGLVSYYGLGHSDAVEDAPFLGRLANRLIYQGRSGEDLGPGREAMLLAVEDPAFAANLGPDVDTPGGSVTSISRALASRMAFDGYTGGVGRIRLAGYARGLEEKLSKRQILALWLETVEMGSVPEGWLKGFFLTSHLMYHRSPAKLSDAEFLRLVAVASDPDSFHLDRPDPALDERVTRITRLLAGTCVRERKGDVKLAPCAEEQP